MVARKVAARKRRSAKANGTLTGQILAAAIQCVVDPIVADMRKEHDAEIAILNTNIGAIDAALGKLKAQYEALQKFYMQRDAAREFRKGLAAANPGIRVG